MLSEWAHEMVQHDFRTYSRDPPPQLLNKRFFRNHVEIAGLHANRSSAIRYIAGAVEADLRGVVHGLELDREPANPHDPNAIRVSGWWGLAKEFLGYVPAAYAPPYAKVADNGGDILAVPKRVYRGHDDFVEIRFVIYGVYP